MQKGKQNSVCRSMWSLLTFQRIGAYRTKFLPEPWPSLLICYVSIALRSAEATWNLNFVR